MSDTVPSSPAATFDANGEQEKDSKAVVTSYVDEDAAIDGVDPVYAAKARVLNRAVSFTSPVELSYTWAEPDERSKKLVWADTNGSCSLSLDLDGLKIIYGQY